MATSINSEIKSYLVSQKAKSIKEFESDSLLFNEVMGRLDTVDIDEVRGRFYQELLYNCNNYWLENIEAIDGIFFEYDYIFNPNEVAMAYGFMFDNMNGLKVQSDPYYIDYRAYPYSFAALFEPAPGITLSVLNPLSELNKVEDMFNTNGFEELRKAYLLTAFLAMHIALGDFVKMDSFRELPKKMPFHFLIQEHDTSISYPLFIVEKGL